MLEFAQPSPSSRSSKPAGVLFPGRSCSTFSPRGEPAPKATKWSSGAGAESDQLGLILQTLGRPTHGEFSWASARAQTLVLQSCGRRWGEERWSDIDSERRTRQLGSQAAQLLPSASESELSLLLSMLALDPLLRPTASALLSHAYFERLPAAERPAVTSVPSASTIESCFSFEHTAMDVCQLRELLADDIYRFAMLEGEGINETARGSSSGSEHQHGKSLRVTMRDLTGGAETPQSGGSAEEEASAPAMAVAIAKCLRW